MMRVATICIAILLASSGASAGDLYKCTMNGKVRYTDTPCSKQETTLGVQGMGKPARNASAKKKDEKDARDAVLDIYGDKADPSRVTGSISLGGAGDVFDCDDPAYAKVNKVPAFTIVASDGAKQLCRVK